MKKTKNIMIFKIRKKCNIRFSIVIVLMTLFWIGNSISYAQGAGKALDFNDQPWVDCRNDTSLNISNEITIEAWAKNDNINDCWSRIVTKGQHLTNAYYGWLLNYYDVSDGKTAVVFCIETNGAQSECHSDYIISQSEWYHVVGTYDGDSIRIYVNGKKRNSKHKTGTMTETGGPYNVLIGKSYGWPEPLIGTIDEVRIWDVALDETTISNWMCKKLTSDHPQWAHLKGYWRFDDEADPTDDYSENNNVGYLEPYNNKPVFINSLAPIGDNGALVNTTNQTDVGPIGGQLKVTITSTPDDNNNLMVYQYGSLSGNPVTQGETFPTGFDKRSDIVWGIKEYGNVTATLVFDYSNVAGVTDPSKIEILKRNDVNDTSWDSLSYTYRDDNAKTITITNVTSFSQFALGGGKDGENPLPVELSTFTAQFLNNKPTLYWITQTETDNLGFNIYRGESDNAYANGNTIKINANIIRGQGTTSEPTDYLFVDENIVEPKTTYWYWLQNVDYSGQMQIYEPVSLIIPEENTNNSGPIFSVKYGLYQNSPNPFNPVVTPRTEVWFNLNKGADVKINIYNVRGEFVKCIYSGYAEFDNSNPQPKIAYWNGKDENGKLQSTGIYLYELNVNGEVFSNKKLMLLR